MSTLFLLNFRPGVFFCGLSSSIDFKKQVMNLKSVQFFFVLTVAAKLPLVSEPKAVVILFLNYFRVVKEVLQITWNKKEVFVGFDPVEKP